MRCRSFAIALAIACSTPVSVDAAAARGAASKAQQRDTWLVWFEEAPLASFRGTEQVKTGRLAGLKATSPEVTGKRKLDVDSSDSRAYRAALSGLREERLAEAGRRIGRVLEPIFVYDVANNGVALELTEDEARALQSVPGVTSVEPDFRRELRTDSGPQWINADAIWGAGAAAGGNRGEGMIIGIVDSGIYSKHPAFDDSGAGFSITNPRGIKYGKCIEASPPSSLRCNNKLIGVYDFTTGAGSEETDDGNDHSGHGTHVAATAAGVPLTRSFSSGTYNMSGVAPRANLISYKGCEDRGAGGCKGSWLIAALNQAVADRVDVINYSIGGSAYNPWQYSSSDAMSMLAAREAGIVVVVAAGNAGPNAGTVETPGNAPWVITVANATHGRAQVKELTFTGGPTPYPGNGFLAGAGGTSGTTGPRPIVYAGNRGSALCAAGSNVDALPPSTSTFPSNWNSSTFHNEIVVCDRGTYARVIKSLNVRNAGGSGMVLVNLAADGESVVADADHSVPATHLGAADGAALKAWLSSGSGHAASIGATRTTNLAAFGDILNSSSSRGPIEGDWLKPNLAAPGTNILAATEGGTNSFAFMSGTSMATPHVAGAAALLLKAHPAWGPSEVTGALESTARNRVRMPDGVTAAGVFEQGSGSVDLAKATKAALYFPISAVEFRNARPGGGTKPRNLNLGALVDSDCFVSCSFTRAVKDLRGGGTWRVDTSGVPGLSASPAQFTLSANGLQPITFTFAPSPGQYPYNAFAQGYVRLSRTSGGSDYPDVAIPVAIRLSSGNVPEILDISDCCIGTPPPGTEVQDGGQRDFSLSGIVALPDARFAGSNLVRPLTATQTLPQDPTNDEPFDGLVANRTVFWLTAATAGEYRFRAEAMSPTAIDIDLFIGTPGSANAPNEDDELCTSRSAVATEVCDVIVTARAGQRFWVVLQNWQSSVAGSDSTQLKAGLVPLAPGSQLMAAGPGHVAQDETFDMRVAWDDPTFAQGEERWGHVLIGSQGDRLGDVGRILTKIERRIGSLVPRIARALVPGDENALDFRLGPNETHDRLYFDVPPNASRIDVQLRGASGNADLYLSRIDFPDGPVVAAAPPVAQAAFKSEGAGSNEDISVSGAALAPGRWYVTPVNKTAVAVDLSLRVRVDYGSARPATRLGAWADPVQTAQGQGSGLFLYRAGNLWAATWYTFLEDGTPVWYQGVEAAPGANDGHWDFALHRYTWNGVEQVESNVGRAQWVLTGEQDAVFSWTLFGVSGSVRYRNIDAGTCMGLGGKRLDGMWAAATPPGYSLTSFAGLEVYTAYNYDDRGMPRWFTGTREGAITSGANAEIVLEQLGNGPCPVCAWSQPSVRDVGVLARRFTDAAHGRFAVDIEYAAPLPGGWGADAATALITDSLDCTP